MLTFQRKFQNLTQQERSVLASVQSQSDFNPKSKFLHLFTDDDIITF